MSTSPGDVAHGTTPIERALEEQIAAINAHDAVRLAACYAEDAVVRDPQYPEPLRGRAAVENDAASFFRGFPDLHAEVTCSVISGTILAVEMTMEGTNTGPLALPSGDVPPTGRLLRFTMAFFDDVDENGSVLDERRYYDVADQAQQLGLSG